MSVIHDPLAGFRSALADYHTRTAAWAADFDAAITSALRPLFDRVQQIGDGIDADLTRVRDGIRGANERIATAAAGLAPVVPAGPDLAAIFATRPRPATPIVVVVLPPHPPTH